jgi:hypothetical protein
MVDVNAHGDPFIVAGRAEQPHLKVGEISRPREGDSISTVTVAVIVIMIHHLIFY